MINTKFHGDTEQGRCNKGGSPGTSPELQSGSKAMGAVVQYIALNVLDILDRFS